MKQKKNNQLCIEVEGKKQFYNKLYYTDSVCADNIVQRLNFVIDFLKNIK